MTKSIVPEEELGIVVLGVYLLGIGRISCFLGWVGGHEIGECFLGCGLLALTCVFSAVDHGLFFFHIMMAVGDSGEESVPVGIGC